MIQYVNLFCNFLFFKFIQVYCLLKTFCKIISKKSI